MQSCKVDRKGKSNSLLGKSISVRNLFHYIGDIHQPLHAGGRVTKAMPDGDRGGNRFYIKHYKPRNFNNLHFLWDHQFDTGEEYWGPLTKPQSAHLTEWSLELMTEYENDATMKKQVSDNWKFTDWENESAQIVKDFVYKGLTENEEIPQDYMEKGLEIARRQIMIGGLRLAKTVFRARKKNLECMNPKKNNNNSNNRRPQKSNSPPAQTQAATPVVSATEEATSSSAEVHISETAAIAAPVEAETETKEVVVPATTTTTEAPVTTETQ